MKSLLVTGSVYGYWTLVSFQGLIYNSKRVWFCRCICGNEKVVEEYNLHSGRSKSCGCMRIKATIIKNTTHGMYGTREYSIWHSMKDRCLNTNHKNYGYYGGRGITVCKRWLKFENFYADMGNVPEGKTLDRIDNNGNYEPANCRWVDWETQMQNRRHYTVRTVS